MYQVTVNAITAEARTPQTAGDALRNALAGQPRGPLVRWSVLAPDSDEPYVGSIRIPADHPDRRAQEFINETADQLTDLLRRDYCESHQ